MCLYPKIIPNKRYLANKKNGGNPPICNDNRKKWVAAGCGKCIECMNQKKRNWQVRLHEEIKQDKTGKFVTLTFSEEELEKLTEEIGTEANEIATVASRRFLERWRKKYGKSIKHWYTTELGHKNTERLHLHGILFTEEANETIEQIWKYGNIWVGEYVNEKTINYIIKYVTKIDQDHKGYQPIVLCTPGIGKSYLEKTIKENKFKDEETNETYRLNNGTKIGLPTYYRNKLWTDEEREKLWINLLDKQTRYVRGEKIDVSTEEGEQEYQEALTYYQQKNKEWGYGDRNWKKKEYKTSKKVLKYLESKK